MVTVLVGPNRFALQKWLHKAKADFAEEHGDLAVEVIDADEADTGQILEAVQSVSLFTPAKMVIVKSLSENKAAAESIERIVESSQQEVKLLIVEPQPDKRSAYYKALKKLVQVKEFVELDENDLAKWIVDEAKSRGASIGSSDARYLVSRVGANQGKIIGELLKLVDYDKQITRGNIDFLTVENPQNTVFELLEAAFGGQTKRAIDIYENLRVSGSQPPVILAMIVWQIHQVALVAHAGDRPIDQIAKDSGAKAFPLQKSQRIAARIGLSGVRELLNSLHDLDYKLKTRGINADDAMKSQLAKIATK